MNRLFLTFASLIFTLVFNCFGTYSQVARIGAVHSKPTKFNDYLILERDYPDASYWDVKILEREFDETDSIYVFSDVQRTRMSKAFYTKIDAKYLNDERYFITVLGYNGDDDIIVEEGPFAICTDCQPGFSCQWGCIGSTYAYSLNLNAVSSGSSMVTMADLTPSSGYYPYYYEWVDGDDWNNFSSCNNCKSYYGLNSFSTYSYENAGKIIQKNVDQNDGYKDANGNLCIGNIYGVRKYIGPWIASNGNMVSNTIAGGESNCGQNFNWAKSTINSNSNNFSSSIPTLSCNGDSFSPSSSDQPDVFENEGEISTDFVSCFHDILESQEGNNTIYEFIEFGNCGENAGIGALSWPTFLEKFTIFSMTDSTFSPVIISKDSIINKDGDIIFNDFNFYPGLYYFGLEHSNGMCFFSYFERQDTTYQNLSQSNFLNYNPYPNPLTSKDYQIDFEATANVEFVYEVKNNQGRSVFSGSYKLDKDETLSDRISLTIPTNYSGFLYNTITFTDGSSLQFTMVK